MIRRYTSIYKRFPVSIYRNSCYFSSCSMSEKIEESREELLALIRKIQDVNPGVVEAARMKIAEEAGAGIDNQSRKKFRITLEKSSGSFISSRLVPNPSVAIMQRLMLCGTNSAKSTGFDMSRYRLRHVALHFSYFGHEFYGFASQDPYKEGGLRPNTSIKAIPVEEIDGLKPLSSPSSADPVDSEPNAPGKRPRSTTSEDSERKSRRHENQKDPNELLTIETLLFSALNQARLIDDRQTSGYSRCGRTDRGVSAAGQIIALRLRSNARRQDILDLQSLPPAVAAELEGLIDRFERESLQLRQQSPSTVEGKKMSKEEREKERLMEQELQTRLKQLEAELVSSISELLVTNGVREILYCNPLSASGLSSSAEYDIGCISSKLALIDKFLRLSISQLKEKENYLVESKISEKKENLRFASVNGYQFVWSRPDGFSNTGEPFPPPDKENDYALTLNTLLPPEIRILGWADVPDDFSARFSANLRTYRYYFVRRDLDLLRMRQAGEMLIGTHDFRNICKIDVQQTQNFVRQIVSIRIAKVDHHTNSNVKFGSDKHESNASSQCGNENLSSSRNFSDLANGAADWKNATTSAAIYLRGASGDDEGTDKGNLSVLPRLYSSRKYVLEQDTRDDEGSEYRDLYYIEVVGRAFLWHQIRCVAAVLFLAGRGLETPDSVKQLLDIETVRGRPNYDLASEFPLCLYHCGFGESEPLKGEFHHEPAFPDVPSFELEEDAEASNNGPVPVTSMNSSILSEKQLLELSEGRVVYRTRFPQLHDTWNSSTSNLKRLTAEVESMWSHSAVKTAMLKGLLDKIYASPVTAAEVADMMKVSLPKDMFLPKNAELHERAKADMKELEILEQKLKESGKRLNWGMVSDMYASNSVFLDKKLPPIGLVSNAEYALQTVPFRGKDGYQTLFERPRTISPEEMFQNLPENVKTGLRYMHPTNTRRLELAIEKMKAISVDPKNQST